MLIKKYKKEIIVTLIYLIYALGFNIYRVQGDGWVYYNFLEKMLFVSHPETPIEALKNAYFLQSGCAFFNTPFYLCAYVIEKLFNLRISFDGITLRQISINLASNFYMVLSLILAVKTLKRLNLKSIILPVISVLVSTSALTVAVIQPSLSHSVDIFICTLFFYLFIKFENDNYAKPWPLGVVAVIAILVRYFNFVLLVVVIAYYLFNKKYSNVKHVIIGFVSTVWLLPLILYVYNGTINPFYRTSILKRSSEVLPIYPKYFLKLLVHPLKGLFVWSPVTILSLIGLSFPNKKEVARIGYYLLSSWVLFLLLYGYTHWWNGGWSFSNRYLVSLFIVYVIGISSLLERKSKIIKPLVILAMIYSIVLFLNWHLCIIHGEYGTPADMFRAWHKGESYTSLDKTVNLKVAINRLWQMCRYKYLFSIFK